MTTLVAKFDVVIVGGGPAGMSAAQWCVETGLSCVLIERSNAFGGQLTSIYNPIKNYLGLETANGREMQNLFLRSLEPLNFERVCGVAVAEIDVDRRMATLVDGRSFEGSRLVIATGVRRRSLNIPGEREFAGRGVVSSGSKEKGDAAGKTVVIVGGGDAALENALILSDFAKTVILVHRSDRFSARPEFVEQVGGRPNVTIMTGMKVISAQGNESVERVTLRSAAGEDQVIQTDLILIRIGVVPNSEMIKGKLETDEAGYIVVDAYGRSSKAGILAIGDVANRLSPTLSTAIGSASSAIKAIEANPIN